MRHLLFPCELVESYIVPQDWDGYYHRTEPWHTGADDGWSADAYFRSVNLDDGLGMHMLQWFEPDRPLTTLDPIKPNKRAGQ